MAEVWGGGGVDNNVLNIEYMTKDKASEINSISLEIDRLRNKLITVNSLLSSEYLSCSIENMQKGKGKELSYRLSDKQGLRTLLHSEADLLRSRLSFLNMKLADL